jgi:hypothetical protein
VKHRHGVLPLPAHAWFAPVAPFAHDRAAFS